MKHTGKRTLGVLLALVLLFSLVPAMGLTASADTAIVWYVSDPVYFNDFFQTLLDSGKNYHACVVSPNSNTAAYYVSSHSGQTLPNSCTYSGITMTAADGTCTSGTGASLIYKDKDGVMLFVGDGALITFTSSGGYIAGIDFEGRGFSAPDLTGGWTAANDFHLRWSGAPAKSVTLKGPSSNLEVLVKSITYSVVDTLPTYTVTVHPGANGMADVSSKTAVQEQRITVDAKPCTGYELDTITWSKDGGVTKTDITAEACFTMPADNVDVYVSFRPAGGGDYGGDDGVYYGAARGCRASLATSAGGSAYLLLSSGEAGTSLSVVPGSLVWVVVTPDPGYEVESIVCTPGGDITAGPSFLMPGCDVAVYVTFRPVA